MSCNIKTMLILFLSCLLYLPCLAKEDTAAAGDTHPMQAPEKPVAVYSGPQAAGYFLIRFYQIFISPQDGPNCRHRPVCSAYGRDAVKTHGVLPGAVMAGDRLLRCNPYMDPMVDPVPDKLSEVKSSKRPRR